MMPHHISLNGKKYYFGFSWFFGPLMLDQRNCEPAQNQAKPFPAGFWPEFAKWLEEHKQGTPNNPA